MSYIYKDIHPEDRTVTPYIAHKKFTLTDETTGSFGVKVYAAVSSSVERFLGTSAPWRDGGWKTPGLTGENTQYKTLVWRWLDTLFYSPHRRTEFSYTVNGAYLQPWVTIDGELVGREGSDGIQYIPPKPLDDVFSLSTGSSTFKTGVEGLITNTNQVTALRESASLMMIPQKYFGEKIKPGSVEIVSQTTGVGTLTDSGSFLYSGSQKVGDVFYEYGAIVVTSTENNLQDTFNNFSMTYNATQKIVEHEYRCVITERDFLKTQNPSVYGPVNLVLAPDYLGSTPMDLSFDDGEISTFSSNDIDPNTHNDSGSLNNGLIRAEADVKMILSSSAGNRYLTAIGQGSGNRDIKIPMILENEKTYQIQFKFLHGGSNFIYRVRKPGINEEDWQGDAHYFSVTLGSSDTGTVISAPFTASFTGMHQLRFSPTSNGTGSIDDILVTEIPNGSGYTGKFLNAAGFTTHSEFSPYISEVGLYDQANNLIAIGKLPRPIQNPKEYDISFVLRFDT